MNKHTFDTWQERDATESSAAVRQLGGSHWQTPITRFGLLLVAACALHAAAVHAQGSQDKHHLIVKAGNPFQGDTEVGRFDGRAEFVWQNGVGGVNPNFFFHEAVADGDAGVLSIASVFSLAGGNGAQLAWDGSGSLADGNDNPSSGSVQAGLRVNRCAVGFQKTFHSSGFGTATPSESCSNTAHVTNIATASAGLLSITQTMDGSARATPAST